MRRALLAAGIVLMVIGLAAMANGWSLVQMERGWAQFIAGAMLFAAGAIVAAISEVVARLDTLVANVRLTRAPRAPATVVPPIVMPEPAMHAALPAPGDLPPPLAMPEPLFPQSVSPDSMPPADEPSKRRISIGALAGAITTGAATTAIFGRRSEPASAPLSSAEPVSSHVASDALARLEKEADDSLFAPQPATPPTTRSAEFDFAPFDKPAAPASEQEHPPVEAPSLDAVGDTSFVEALEDLRLTPDDEALPPVEAAPPLPEAAPQAAFQAAPQVTPQLSGEIDEMAWLDAALQGVELPKEPEWAPRVATQSADDVNMVFVEKHRVEFAFEEVPPPPSSPVIEAPVEAPPTEPALPVADDERDWPAEESKDGPVEPPLDSPAEVASAAVVRRYESQGVIYTLYDDGGVDAETPTGKFHFTSVAELREFLAKPA